MSADRAQYVTKDRSGHMSGFQSSKGPGAVHAATPLAANPAENVDGSSGRLTSATTELNSIVDIYRNIHQSIDVLLQQNLIIDTITKENARVLSRLTAVERLARATREASGSHSRVTAEDGQRNESPNLQCGTGEACPSLSLVRELERSQNETAYKAGPLSHSDQASPQSAHLMNCQDHDFEDSEYSTNDPSSTTPSPERSLRHHSRHTISASMGKDRELQAHRIVRQDQTDCTSPSNDMAGRKRKRPSRKIEHKDESHERIAETFGADSDLEYFERIIDDTKANAHWISGAWNPRNLLSTPDVDPLQFVQAVPTLVMELEDNDFAERLLQVKQRMALAHFYRAYRSAHENHDMFLRWTDGIGSGVSLTPCNGRRMESIVKQRLIDISVWQSQRDRKQAAVKTNNWQRCGKPWAELIVRLGYSSLLLVPPSMTNKRMHSTPQDEFQSLLTAIEARKSSFANSLARADAIMEKLFQYATPPMIADRRHDAMQPGPWCWIPAPQHPETVNPTMLTFDHNHECADYIW
ncbi:hypothetical protein LTR09_012721 [Extremus antarcticus]|uniref:Uncharacterized protein n=1 Tax=Extremus antarcticus TaxID=702011 RepID=A0AAJ0D4D7_9PEZI|nr:hypothetical protein LTR09_012721 [Extremus antarcticus]